MPARPSPYVSPAAARTHGLSRSSTQTSCASDAQSIPTNHSSRQHRWFLRLIGSTRRGVPSPLYLALGGASPHWMDPTDRLAGAQIRPRRSSAGPPRHSRRGSRARCSTHATRRRARLWKLPEPVDAQNAPTSSLETTKRFPQAPTALLPSPHEEDQSMVQGPPRATPARVPRWGPRRRARRRQPVTRAFRRAPRGPRRADFARWGGSVGLFADRTRQKLISQRALSFSLPTSGCWLFQQPASGYGGRCSRPRVLERTDAPCTDRNDRTRCRWRPGNESSRRDRRA